MIIFVIYFWDLRTIHCGFVYQKNKIWIIVLLRLVDSKRRIGNSLIKAFKLFLHSSVQCTPIRPAQWKGGGPPTASICFSVPLFENILTPFLSLVALPTSVSPFSSPMIQALSQSLISFENGASVTLQNTHVTSRGKVPFVCGSVTGLNYGLKRDRFFFWMPPLSIRHLPHYHLPLPSYLSLITHISFSPWAIATKAASRMFSKGDLKAWPIKWRQGQIFRLKQPDLLRHTERWREKE